MKHGGPLSSCPRGYLFADHVSSIPGMVDPPDRRHVYCMLECLVTITVDLLVSSVLLDSRDGGQITHDKKRDHLKKPHPRQSTSEKD